MKTTTSDVFTSHDSQSTTDTATSGPSTGPRVAEPVGSGSVWGPPLLKVGVSAILLILVAYLGHLSHRLESYGPIRVLDEHVIRLVDAAHSTPQPSLGPRAHDFAANIDRPVEAAPVAVAGDTPQVEAQEHAAKKAGCPEEKTTPSLKGILPDGRVVLNDASADELTTLPGIGPARASAIIELRTRLKGFKKVEDLLRIRGIGWKSLAKLKERVVVSRPLEAPVAPAPEFSPALSQPAPSRSKLEKDNGVGRGQAPSNTRQIVASMGG